MVATPEGRAKVRHRIMPDVGSNDTVAGAIRPCLSESTIGEVRANNGAGFDSLLNLITGARTLILNSSLVLEVSERFRIYSTCSWDLWVLLAVNFVVFQTSRLCATLVFRVYNDVVTMCCIDCRFFFVFLRFACCETVLNMSVN